MKKYILTDGNRNYIMFSTSTNQYAPTTKFELCEKYDSRSKANNIWKSSISKILRKKYHVEEVEIQQETDELDRENGGRLKDISKESVEQSNIGYYLEHIKGINEFVKTANERYDSLTEMQSELDKEIVDLHHYIELHDLSAYQGWVCFKALQIRLRKRRNIKDEIFMIQQLNLCNIDRKAVGDAVKSVAGLNNRQYTPRVLTDLFKNGNKI